MSRGSSAEIKIAKQLANCLLEKEREKRENRNPSEMFFTAGSLNPKPARFPVT